MKAGSIFVLILLFIATLLITDLPNFHLEGLFGLNNSHTTDIIAHGSYYFVISFPLFLVFRNRKISLGTFCVLLLIPALLELSQAFIPGRTASLYDMFGNYIGLIVGLAICLLCQHFWQLLKSCAQTP